MSNVQRALLAGPGRFDAVCLYRDSAQGVAVRQIRGAAARLISFFQDSTCCPDNLRVLVALAPTVLEQKVPASFSAEAITSIGNGRFPIGDAAVFVQISAQSDAHRMYALRVVNEVLGPVLTSCREIMGARLLNGQETFGFPDGTPGLGNYSRSVANALPADGAWLLFQRFRQNATEFFRSAKTPLEMALIVGIAPVGTRRSEAQVQKHVAAQPPMHAHVPLMRAAKATIIRRGFPCRHNGEEGLAFVGVTPAFDTIPHLLRRMNDTPDALLPFIEAREGGLFYCPPSVDWLEAQDQPAFTPLTTGPLGTPDTHLL
jgi:deferrochelatase/peroxidase EfeB